MGLVCPNCRTNGFATVSLASTLSAEKCGSCAGLWITSARYFSFLASEVREAGVRAGVKIIEGPADAGGMKLCPACGRFMRPNEVGHGLKFGIDRCGACGGMWLNAGEWESLAARGLERKLHYVASDGWQAEVERAKRAEIERAAFVRRVGREDFEEVERIGRWLEEHAHRTELFAYLRERHERSEERIRNEAAGATRRAG